MWLHLYPYVTFSNYYSTNLYFMKLFKPIIPYVMNKCMCRRQGWRRHTTSQQCQRRAAGQQRVAQSRLPHAGQGDARAASLQAQVCT